MKKKLLSLLLCLLLVSVMMPTVIAAAPNDTYDARTVYYAGDTVNYDGITYTAKWWTQGTAPGSANSPWERATEYDVNGIAIWYEGMVCMGGSQVSYNGNIYTAKWWTTSEPGSDVSWESNSGQIDDPIDNPVDDPIDDPVDDPITDPETPIDPQEPVDDTVWNAGKIYYQGDTVIYNGITYTAKWWTRGDEPSSSAAWERETQTDENGTPVWHEGMVCVGGAQVLYNGIVYTAKWWTTSEPGTDAAWGATSDPIDNPIDDPVDDPIDDPVDDPVDDPITDPETPIDPQEPVDDTVWSAGKIYYQGDTVIYNGITYTAKWWTTSEPGSDASWESNNGQIDDPVDNPIDEPNVDPTAPIQFYSNYTVDAALVSDGDNTFKTVGYFPFYSDFWADNIQWDCLTHIVYAFVFPNGQGGLQPVDRPQLIQKMITEGHENGVEVLLGVGGWAYYGDIMEYKFDANTATPELIDSFTDEIVALVEQYGFDGVDMDWEHPRAGTNSWKNYEAMMIQLREKLGSDKLLTAAVLSGVTTNGITYYDAAAHTANVMAVCDWINVMAYDCVCTLEFCQDVAEYWCGTRGVPTNKVCMGVPFYAYPSAAIYSAMVNKDGDSAVNNDYEGTTNYHNGIPTIQAKTIWAKEYGLGGMMIWELSQDTTDSTSLLRAIYNAANGLS